MDEKAICIFMLWPLTTRQVQMISLNLCYRLLRTMQENHYCQRWLFIQLCNCRRENQNRYTLSVFEFLVRLLEFEFVEVSFLQVWHTYCDVDQSFRATSDMRHYDDVTMIELHEQLCPCCKNHTAESSLKEAANLSSLCCKTGCLNSLNLLNQCSLFQFKIMQKEKKRKGWVCLHVFKMWCKVYSTRALDFIGIRTERNCLLLVCHWSVTATIQIAEGSWWSGDIISQIKSEESRTNSGMYVSLWHSETKTTGPSVTLH